MTTRRWTFRGSGELGELHVVELTHGWFTGRRKLVVNGHVLLDKTTFLDGGSHHTFELDGRACSVEITCPTGITYRYTLRVDGEEMPFDARNASDVSLAAVASKSGMMPVSTSPPRAQPRDVPVQNRFIDFSRWFKGER